MKNAYDMPQVPVKVSMPSLSDTEVSNSENGFKERHSRQAQVSSCWLGEPAPEGWIGSKALVWERYQCHKCSNQESSGRTVTYSNKSMFKFYISEKYWSDHGQNAFSEKLFEHGFNFYEMFTPDLLHEFELGVWKAVFTHLLRILYAIGDGKIQELNKRCVMV